MLKPEEQVELVRLFLQSKGFCVYGHSPCKGTLEQTTIAVCGWRSIEKRPFVCLKDTKEGDLCPIRQEDKPQLPCHREHIVKLIWHCGYGDYPCYKPFECHYELVASRLVREWASDRRRQANAEWQAERKAIHAMGERREPIRGRFNMISRDIVLASQPSYYLEGLGIDGLTFKPFAKVRISSTYMHLFISLGDSLKPMSKNKRRKAVRHGKPLPKGIANRIDLIVNKAVRDYLKR